NSLLEAAAFGRRTGRAAAGEAGAVGETLTVEAAPDLSDEALETLRRVMSDEVGVVRDAAGLARALTMIDALEAVAPGALPLITARLITQAALERRESRGGHFRRDYPDSASVARHTRLNAQSQDAQSFASAERAA